MQESGTLSSHLRPHDSADGNHARFVQLREHAMLPTQVELKALQETLRG